MHLAGIAAGSYFSIEVEENLQTLNQVISVESDAGCVVCGFSLLSPDDGKDLVYEDLISVQLLTRDSLKSRSWSFLRKGEPIDVSRSFDLDQKREKNFVGSSVIGARTIEEFIAACFGVTPWDAWAEPKYFDGLLINKGSRPDAARLNAL